MTRTICVVVSSAAFTTALVAQDTVRVLADGPPVWGPNVKLVEELAIGQTDGPPEYAFGIIYRVAAEPGGAFYVFDVNDAQIRRYDARGRFTGKIGRKGSGPGEYQNIGGMTVDANGSLVIYDDNNKRVTHFGADGKVRSEFTMPRPSWPDFVIDSAGRYYFRVYAGGGFSESTAAGQQYVRYSAQGRIIDSLPIPQVVARTPIPNTFALSTSDGMRLNFITESVFAPNLTGGFVAAASNAYRLLASNGARIMVIERPVAPVRIDGEERAQWQEWADSMRLRGRGQTNPEIPRTKPFIRQLRTDLQGRIWVEVYAEAERRTNLPPRRTNGGKQILFWRERTTFDVFSPRGQFLGRVALPQQSVLMDIRGNRLYVRGKGPDDEDRLVVWRLDVPD